MTPTEWQAVKADLLGAAEGIPQKCRIVGSGTKAVFSKEPLAEFEDWRLPRAESPVISLSPGDQVGVFWARAEIAEIQAELAPLGLSLPIPRTGHPLLDGIPGTLGGWCAANLPHALSGWVGSPRDSVLGMGVILADGTVAKCGAQVVKSVAGYDIHRMLCGSWGSLAAIGCVTVRLSPVAALPSPTAQADAEWRGEPVWIQRVRRSDFVAATRRVRNLVAWDQVSATLWFSSPPKRFADDWVLGPEGEAGPRPTPDDLIERAKNVLDPNRRWILPCR